jgi:hypothetical protein
MVLASGASYASGSGTGEFHTENYDDDDDEDDEKGDNSDSDDYDPSAVDDDDDDDDDEDSDVSDDDDSDDDDESEASSEIDETTTVNRQDETIQNLAKRETAFVRMWRTIVISAMVLTGAFLTIGTYLVLRNQEREEGRQAVRNGLSMDGASCIFCFCFLLLWSILSPFVFVVLTLLSFFVVLLFFFFPSITNTSRVPPANWCSALPPCARTCKLCRSR